MYTSPDFKTKKALKDAVKDGRRVTVYQPNNVFGVPDPIDASGIVIEGPAGYHRWYAQVTVKDGSVTNVK